MLGPKGTLKPLTAAIVLSLLIHGGLLAVIAVNSQLRQQAEAARVAAGANSSRVQFFVMDAEDNGGRVGSQMADSKAVPAQVEPPPSPLAHSPETPRPPGGAPTGLLTVGLEANREPAGTDHSSDSPPGAIGESGGGVLPGI